jgi:protein-tyrosine-phosphatase
MPLANLTLCLLLLLARCCVAQPDPYYGGAEGFEEVLDLLEDACSGLLTQLEAGNA